MIFFASRVLRHRQIHLLPLLSTIHLILVPMPTLPHSYFSLTFPQTFSQTFPQTFPQPTETSNNPICPEKGGVLRTSESKWQLVREKVWFYGQTWTEAPRQTWTGVSRTNVDWSHTYKRGLRFTDRSSLDFPDVLHLNFPDARYLNFLDASYLTKRPKSGTTELPSRDGSGRTYRPRY